MTYQFQTQDFAGVDVSRAIDATMKCLYFKDIADRFAYDPSLTDFKERQALQGSLAYLRETARKLRMPEADKLADRVEKLFRRKRK